jgi:hypothetical protein
LAALVVMALFVVLFILATKVLLGPGPTAPGGAAASPGRATLPASDLPTGSPADVLAPVTSCTTLPSGKLPTGLALTSTSSGIGTDPAVGYSNPFISIELTGGVQPATPALSLIAAILPFHSTAPPSATASPNNQLINRAGTLQLIAYWDGSRWHGALRTWSGSAWSLLVGAASGVDVVQNGAAVTLYWEGLASGDKYGVIIATSGGCADLGMSPALLPGQTYGAAPSA